MIKFILLSNLLFSDEALLWELTDIRFHKEQLCEAYIDGEEYLFERESCTRLGCSKWKYTVKTFCQNETAIIEQWKSSGIFSRETISKDQWTEHRGNHLRFRAAFHTSYGKYFSLVDAVQDSENNLHIRYQVSDSNVIETGTWILSTGPSIPMSLMQKSIKKNFLQEVTTDVFLQRIK